MTSYEALSRAIDYLVAHYQEQPSLDKVAALCGYEPTYFQKLFQDNVGLSPKKFIQYLSMRTAREFLLNGASTLDAAYAAGLSGNRSLHDVSLSCIAASPGEIKRKGEGVVIRYGFYPSVIGELIIAQTEKGICYLAFQMDQSRTQAIEHLKELWLRADFIQDDAAIKPTAENLLTIWKGASSGQKVNLHLFGTNFQMQVWQALLRIPSATTVSYQTIAQAIGRPTAQRAVGSAIGANPIALLIPCHRVIQSSGVVENYAWGSARKKAILGIEASRLA